MEKIILFDAYGTLFKVDTESKDLKDALGDSKDAFIKLWRQKLLEYSWLSSLADEWENFNALVSKAILFCCESFKVDSEVLLPILKEIYEHPHLYEDAKQMIPSLMGVKCILSNGHEETLKTAINENGVAQYFDQVFSASKVKNFKVSPQVYRMATKHYNIGPSNIFFVSSNAWDITGAHYFGYKTVWVNRNNDVFDKLVERPDFEIKSLHDLGKIVNHVLSKPI